jgi:hypothetical protein
MLLFVGLYAGTQSAGIAVIPTAAMLGTLLFAGLLALSVWRLRKQ